MSAQRAGSVLVMPARCSDELPHAVEEVLGEAAIEFARELATGPPVIAPSGAVLAQEIERAFAESQGPLLVVWPSVPRLRIQTGEGALRDLAAGCDLVLGPLTDGGLYLLGLARAVPALLAFPESVWRTEDAMPIAFTAAHDHDLTVGILRAERGLTTVADARAALVDPLLPERIAQAVGQPER